MKITIMGLATSLAFLVVHASAYDSSCSPSVIKANFQEACVAGVQADRALDHMTGSLAGSSKTDEEICRCIAGAYTVENAAHPPLCSYKDATIQSLIRDAHKKTQCF